MKSSPRPTIVWFRQDLRLQDNAALAYAIERGRPVIPVFIWSESEADRWHPGAASRWALHHALMSLQANFAARGLQLIIIKEASCLEGLKELIRQTDAQGVVWNRRYEPFLRKLDVTVKRELVAAGLEVKSFNSTLLNEPHTVASGSGAPYKVYTPYWKKVYTRAVDAPIAVDLERLQPIRMKLRSNEIADLELLPNIPWDYEIATAWNMSEAAAQKRLDSFLAGPILNYASDRDRPDFEGTSSLSPYLKWGLIGPRQIYHAVEQHCDLEQDGVHIYLKELYWREFAYNVLYHFPHTSDQALRPEYDRFPWAENPDYLQAWRCGRTGYPIVDAGMRQLWQTGWMHNRVRMIVSSILVKHLLQPWRRGAEWFWDTLLDADLASNSLGWQWSGGCGADAAPYFRIFNPITQGQKFDPDGHYVRRYLPELRGLDAAIIHQPWEASPRDLKQAGLELGREYPLPIVPHADGRRRALAALAEFKQQQALAK